MSLFDGARSKTAHLYLRTMLTPEMLRLIDWSLQEDLGECDHTSASSLPAGLQREGWILAKEDGVVAGLAVAWEVFRVEFWNSKRRKHQMQYWSPRFQGRFHALENPPENEVAPFWTPLAQLLRPLQPRVDQLNRNSECALGELSPSPRGS